MTVGKRGEDSERSLPLENYRLEERGQSGSFVNKDKKRHVFIRFKKQSNRAIENIRGRSGYKRRLRAL